MTKNEKTTVLMSRKIVELKKKICLPCSIVEMKRTAQRHNYYAAWRVAVKVK